jgi:DNA-binding MarR family transcriptional regulator
MLSTNKLCQNDSVLSIKNSEVSELVPLLVADIYHLAGAFRDLGNHIAGKVGQTQARWQVLSVISNGPRTVAQMARRLGYARQSVQRTADLLAEAALVQYRPNPDHAKSPLVEITTEGKSALARITREAEKCHVELAAGLKRNELATALKVVRQLCSALENEPR